MSQPSPDGPTRLTPAAADGGFDAAAAAARRVVDSLVRLGWDSDIDLDGLAERLEAIADELDAQAPDFDTRLRQMWAPGRPNRVDPIAGPENPIAPPMVVHGLDDGSVRGEVRLGMAYQGQPGHAHGGVSAMLLDHALGISNNWAGVSGMTARLVLNYRRPVPLDTDLVISARQHRVDGRKIYTDGVLSVGGEEYVSAEALFVKGHIKRPDA